MGLMWHNFWHLDICPKWCRVSSIYRMQINFLMSPQYKNKLKNFPFLSSVWNNLVTHSSGKILISSKVHLDKVIKFRVLPALYSEISDWSTYILPNIHVNTSGEWYYCESRSIESDSMEFFMFNCGLFWMNSTVKVKIINVQMTHHK